MSLQPRPPRRARHLIDPARPRTRATAEDLARLERVQRSVMSVLVVTTVAHLSVGLVIAAVVIDDSQRGPQVGLCLLGGAFGITAVAAALAIHRRSFASPWLVLGLLPTVVGLVLVLG